MPAPDLRINGECLKTLDVNDACWYLGYWVTENGDMTATREVVREKAPVRVTHDLIKLAGPPADARTFCRTLRTERNDRRLPVLGCRPYRMVAV